MNAGSAPQPVYKHLCAVWTAPATAGTAQPGEEAQRHPGAPLVTSTWARPTMDFGVDVLGFDYLCEGATPAPFAHDLPALCASRPWDKPLEKVGCSQTAMLATLAAAAGRMSLLLDHRGHQAQAALRLSMAMSSYAPEGCLESSRWPAAFLAADAAGFPRGIPPYGPFEVAYAKTSYVELLGGGKRLEPGLMSRAAGGVLWLPELARMDGRTLARIDGVSREGIVRIVRGGEPTACYEMPADARVVGLLGEGELLPAAAPDGMFDLRCEVAGTDGPATIAWLDSWGHDRPQDLTLDELQTLVGQASESYKEALAADDAPFRTLLAMDEVRERVAMNLERTGARGMDFERANRATLALAGLRDAVPCAADVDAAFEIAFLEPEVRESVPRDDCDSPVVEERAYEAEDKSLTNRAR